jgi:hypothetical protein
MSDAAQFEPLNHEVFQKPSPVQPFVELWQTPENYRSSPAGKKLPPRIKVWRVQRSGNDYGGVVSFGGGYADSPDAEVLAQGYNTGKEYGDVGIGRHANFLQWGYSSPPSQMTNAGRALFLNCICYIRKFDGKMPLVRRVSAPRTDAIRLGLLVDLIKDKSFFGSVFPQEQVDQYQGKSAAFAKYWQDNLELVYRNKFFLVDEELKSLGIPSNRTVAALGQMIALLKDDKTAAKGRLLLKRYTVETFETPEQWQAWFDANKDRIYFSDVGGYKFRVVPAGY